MSAATFSDIRSLHGPGAISVVGDRKGSHANTFITCGTDGTLYVWDEKTFTTEKSSADVKNVGEQTYSIVSWHGNNVYFGYLEMDLISGMDKKRVGMASLDNLEEITPLMTFNLEPTCIDASEDFLVAGSSEFIIKVTKHKDGDALANVEVDGEVLCVKIDPKQEFLAAAISDGSIIILNLQEATEEETPQVTKIAAVFPAVNTISVESPRAEISWSRNGDFLYVPSTGTIKTIDRRDWTVDSDILKAPGRELDHFSVCSLSPCGRILVASTMNRHICLWNLSDQTFIAQYEYNRNSPGKTFVTGLHFASFDTRSVIVVDSNEGMCLVKNAVPIKLQKPESREQVETEIAKKRKQILDSDDEEDNDEPKRPGSFLDDAADEDTRLSIDIGAIKKKFGYTNQSSLDDYFDKDGAEKELLTDFGGLEKSGPVVQKVTQIVEYEPPAIPNHFASGSTPRNAGSRYIKWNGFGMIRSVQDDDANNIEIEFHNASIHSEIIFENTANYSLGDLSDEAIALANTVNTEDSEEMAELWVHHVTAWDSSNRKWTTNLPKGENPVDILVSRKMITVLTDQRNLRVFTLQGTQRCVIAHPGPSLTACCFETRVAVVSLAGSEYFEKERRKAQHNYIATVYNLDPRRWFQSQSNVSTVNVPVKPGETIIWTGYTSEGKLCVVDSSYSVRILTHGGFWLPIFEGSSISRSKSDALWPIAVMDGAQKQFRYLYCRGSKYPLISLKLTPTIAPWQLPLCQPEAEKSKYEEELLLNELDQGEAQRTGAEVNSLMAKHLQCIVKLFALSCKSERETRAYELAQLVSSTKGIQALVNFASKSRRSVLSEKIAVFGRDNEAASSVRQDDFLAPKRVVMARRSTAIATETIVSSQQDIFADSQDPESEMSSIRGTLDLDVSMQSSPVRTFSKNPFKRSAEPTQESSSSSRSVFDHLEESFENPRKRTREETASNPAPAGKQTKLDFGKGKENKLNPYAMWLEENEDSLKKTFSGDVADFEKYCVGQFRILPAAQKKILKDRIEALST